MKAIDQKLLVLIEEIVGRENVHSDANHYSVNTLDFFVSVSIAVLPASQEEVIQVVRLLNEHNVNFYPVSTGKNWGYGSGTPPTKDCVILDLSRLNRIVAFNSELGYITLEPGVTQEQLFNYLESQTPGRFMVPTTGAGPTVSLIGNAIERGYGITPFEDHFLSLTSLRAVLADGTVYTSALDELGGAYSDRVFKWNMGPFLDGLFSQSNLGVVLEGTIALCLRPKNVTQFIVFLKEDYLEDAVIAIREIKHQLKSLSGGINLMSKRRLLAMMYLEWTHEKALDEIRVIELAKMKNLPDWVIVGGLYCSDELIGSARKVIRKECRFAQRIIFMSRKKYNLAKTILKFLPFKSLKQNLENAGKALDVLEGRPSQVAMPLAYIRNKQPPVGEKLNPDIDGCGLYWFAPIIPLEAPLVRDFAQEVNKICLYYDIEPLITLTTISEKCLLATIPLLYDKHLLGEVEKVRTCQNHLLRMCRAMDIFPYRLGIDEMDLFKNPDLTFVKIIDKIKSALDPKKVIAPGRYGL